MQRDYYQWDNLATRLMRNEVLKVEHAAFYNSNETLAGEPKECP
jgi:hypothetical protein